jgi:hypothetical protein
VIRDIRKQYMEPVHLGIDMDEAFKRSFKALDSILKERKILNNQERSHVKDTTEKFCKNV